MTDFTFMVEDSSYMFVTGPNVVRTVTHQEITAEDLGEPRYTVKKAGWRILSCTTILASGKYGRLINYLPSNNKQRAPLLDLRDPVDRMDPALDYLIPSNPNQTYDMKILITSILDGAEFLEYQAKFAGNIICGFGRLGGQTIGLIANQPAVLAGVLDVNASTKAARFVRFCDSFNIPLILPG